MTTTARPRRRVGESDRDLRARRAEWKVQADAHCVVANAYSDLHAEQLHAAQEFDILRFAPGSTVEGPEDLTVRYAADRPVFELVAQTPADLDDTPVPVLTGVPARLEALQLAVLRRASLERKIAGEVEQLRALGESWSSIGDRLGVTKQAARQRYGA